MPAGGMVHIVCAREDWGAMATQLLEAAARVREPQTAVRTTSEGFWVPVAVHRDLFPSLYLDEE